MIKIYRLQTIDGVGPYNSTCDASNHLVEHLPPDLYPNSKALDKMREVRGSKFLSIDWDHLDPDLLFGWKTKTRMNKFVMKNKFARKWKKDSGLFWFEFEIDKKDCEFFPDGQVVFYKSKAISVKVME